MGANVRGVVRLGPNHKDFGKPIELAPYPNTRRARNRVGKAPHGVELLSPTALLVAYSREHDRRSGQICSCGLCERLRVLVAQARGGCNGR